MALFRLGSENPLIRRVRRHRSVSTLFRRASQSPKPDSIMSTETGPETSTEIVQAEMVSMQRPIMPETQAPTADRLSPGPPPETAPLSSIRTPPKQAAERQLTGGVGVSKPSEAPSAPSSSPIPQGRLPYASTAEEPTVPAPSASAESVETLETTEKVSSITEAVWQRLRTIFQRHQGSEDGSSIPSKTELEAEGPTVEPTISDLERENPGERQGAEASGESAIAPPASRLPATVQRQIVEDPKGDRPNSERRSQAASKLQSSPSDDGTITTGLQRQTELESAEWSLSAGVDADPDEITDTQNLPSEPVDAVVETTIGETESDMASSTEQNLSAEIHAAEDSERVELEQPTIIGKSKRDRLEITNGPAEKSENQPDTTDIPDDTSRRAEPHRDRPPLHEIWSVQNTAPRSKSASSPPTITSQALPTGTDTTPQVQQVMRQAVSGRPTRSSIEVIQPRRPRPSTLPTEGPRVPGYGESRPSSVDSEVGRDIDRETAHQRPTQGENSSSELDERSEMIETEIGLLPEDLWELIGEPTPTKGKVPDSRSTQIERPTETGAGKLPRERAVPIALPSEGEGLSSETNGPHDQPPSLPAPPAPASGAATIVQRTESSEAETSDTQSEAEEASEGDVDIDELARRVYGEVRRRIAVELERMRSYF
jgi:hypothetical protein